MCDHTICSSVQMGTTLKIKDLHMRIVQLEREVNMKHTRIVNLIQDKINLELSIIRNMDDRCMLQRELEIERSAKHISNNDTHRDLIEESKQLKLENLDLNMQIAKLEAKHKNVNYWESSLVDERKRHLSELNKVLLEKQSMLTIIEEYEMKVKETERLLSEYKYKIDECYSKLAKEKNQQEHDLKLMQERYNQNLILNHGKVPRDIPACAYTPMTVNNQLLEQQPFMMHEEAKHLEEEKLEFHEQYVEVIPAKGIDEGTNEERLQKNEDETEEKMKIIHDLKSKVSNLQNKLSKAETEKEKYQNQLKSMEEKHATSPDRLRDEAEEIQNVLSEHENTITKIKSENAELRFRFNEMKEEHAKEIRQNIIDSEQIKSILNKHQNDLNEKDDLIKKLKEERAEKEVIINQREYKHSHEVKLLSNEKEGQSKLLKPKTYNTSDEVLKCKEKVKSLQTDLETKCVEIQDLKATINQNEVDSQKLLLEHRDQINQIQKAQEEIVKLTNENNYISKQLSTVVGISEVRKQQLVQKDKEIKDLSSRLAREMSTKVSSDERSLENVSIKNRPMNIASEYEMVCSTEWHEAKGTMDTSCGQMLEEDKIGLLCSVFEVTQSMAYQQLRQIMENLANMITQPFEYLSGSSQSKGHSIPIQIEVLIGDLLRNNADSINTTQIMQEVNTKLLKKSAQTLAMVFDEKPMITFIETSLRLAWKMVLQRPTMCFRQEGIGQKWQGENKQEVFFSSSDPNDPKSRVKYYVHPALYHGDTLMVKGRVFLSNQ